LSTSHWTHIICTIDIASGTLQLYVAGELEVDEMGISIEPSRSMSVGSVELVADTNGASLIFPDVLVCYL
jgi:hypothetical protein